MRVKLIFLTDDLRMLFFVKTQNPKPEVKAMISSILAGYIWDEQNPTVKNARSQFVTAAQVCC